MNLWMYTSVLYTTGMTKICLPVLFFCCVSPVQSLPIFWVALHFSFLSEKTIKIFYSDICFSLDPKSTGFSF